VIEDRLLIRRFNAGDMEALRRIYEKYKPDLLSIAGALLNDTAAIEDVLHDTILQLLVFCARFFDKADVIA